MGQRILIAEDNQSLALNISQLLSRQGFVVEHQADGGSALRAIATHPPHLLLLDLKLPGLHGLDLLKKLRQSPRTNHLPVIIISGISKDEPLSRAARALGVSHYLEKPFKAGALLQAIAQLLPGANPGQGGHPVFQSLRSAFLKEFCGRLELSVSGTLHHLTFVRGAPVSLCPGFQHPDFGRFLFDKKLLSETEWSCFKASPANRFNFLVQIGCFDFTTLLQAELDYLEQEILAGFPLIAESARWQSMANLALQQPALLNVPQLFYAGYHQTPDHGARLIKTFEHRFATTTEDFYRHINFLTLNEPEQRLLARINGQKRLAELCPGDHDFGPLLLTLTSLNMLRFAAEPTPAALPEGLPIRVLFNACEDEFEAAGAEALESFSDLVDADEGAVTAISAIGQLPAAVVSAETEDLGQEVRLMAKSLEGQDHYQVFGIKPAKFSIDLLKERYFAITRRFGPDILMQLGGEEAMLLEKILSRVATAYDTLSDVVKKERYDELLGSEKIGLGREGDDRFQAEVQAESGKVFLDMEDWDSAEKALQEAVNFDPNNGDFLASLAWAIYRNPKNAASQAMHNKAKQMLNKALTMERLPQGFAYKGWILFEAGQDSLAEAEFNKTLKLDARHALARKGLRAIQEKREQQKRGLFKRMFR